MSPILERLQVPIKFQSVLPPLHSFLVHFREILVPLDLFKLRQNLTALCLNANYKSKVCVFQIAGNVRNS